MTGSTLLKEFISDRILIVSETMDTSDLRSKVMETDSEFIVVTSEAGLPSRVCDTASFLYGDRDATVELGRASLNWPKPILVDASVPPLHLITLLANPKSKDAQTIVILQDRSVEGVIPDSSLRRLLTSLANAAGLAPTRSPDIYGMLALLNAPTLVCYRCPICQSLARSSIHTDLPLCSTPWHGRMVMTACPDSYRSPIE